MKTASSTNSGTLNSRRSLRQLLSELKKHPFKFVPERSVECLNQFFSGYQTFGPTLGWELNGFEEWLKKHLYYPADSEVNWWRIIKLHSRDKFHSYEMFFQLYANSTLLRFLVAKYHRVRLGYCRRLWLGKNANTKLQKI